MVQPHLVILLETCEIREAVIVRFHSVTGHIQMLVGIIVDVM
jgi:hypothetical protein